MEANPYSRTRMPGSPVGIERADGARETILLEYDMPVEFLMCQASRPLGKYYHDETEQRVNGPSGSGSFFCPLRTIQTARSYVRGSRPPSASDMHILFARERNPHAGEGRTFRKVIITAARGEDGRYVERPLPAPRMFGEGYLGRDGGCIGFDEFLAAATSALEMGSVFRSQALLLNWRKRFSDCSAPHLAWFFVIVEIGGVPGKCRLDHLLAMIKMREAPGWSGDEVLGVVPFRRECNSRMPFWSVLYSADEAFPYPEARNIGNVDHVHPRSRGGLDRLVNMQMMRTFDNSVKGSEPAEAACDVVATRRALSHLAAAARAIASRDPSDRRARQLEALLSCELRACDEHAHAA